MQELLNRKKPRANRYDYTSAGVYFVTVCTQNHEEYFGKVVNEKMVLDEIGIFCDEELHLMLQKRPSVDMHEYIIMPNHIHLLLCVGETDNNNINICRDEACPLPNKTPTQHIPNKTPTQHISNKEPTQHILSEEAVSPTPIQPANITNQTLWSIIWWWKAAVSMRCCRKGILFWRQSSYHDHIIRNEKEYENIKRYIQNNPKKWAEDKMYVKR